MATPKEAGGDAVKQAVSLARDIAPEMEAILLTHYPDAETLDTFLPGAPPLATVHAINQGVARAMAAAGVEVLVQRADRAAYRRWRDTLDEAPGPGEWMDRAGLLRGAAAFQLLGLPPAAKPAGPPLGKPAGPIVDKLLAAFEDEGSDGFETLVNRVLAEGRQDVVDLAGRKTASRHGQPAAVELMQALAGVAEVGEFGPSGWASLVCLPVGLPADRLPDAAAIVAGLSASGALPETTEIRLLPRWHAPDAVVGMPPAALRRLLVDLLAGRDPQDLRAGDPADLVELGFGVLVGVEIDWDIPQWDRILAEGGLPETDEEEDEAEQEAAEEQEANRFDAWRISVFDSQDGTVPLGLVPPTAVAAEIEEFIAEAGEQTEGIEEIRHFVDVARAEVGEEEVVCRAEVVGDSLDLALYTVSGRFLDGMTMEAERMPAPAEQMVKLLEAFIRVVKDTPGR